jgi:hypothetical protein
VRWLNVRFRDAAGAFETAAPMISCLLFNVVRMRANHPLAFTDTSIRYCCKRFAIRCFCWSKQRGYISIRSLPTTTSPVPIGLSRGCNVLCSQDPLARSRYLKLTSRNGCTIATDAYRRHRDDCYQTTAKSRLNGSSVIPHIRHHARVISRP